MLPALEGIPGHLPSAKVVPVFASLSLFSLVSQVPGQHVPQHTELLLWMGTGKLVFQPSRWLSKHKST